MKKLFLLATLFVTTVCNAQVVLWDGTDKEVGSDGGFWNRAEPTVVEENGNTIMKFTLKGNPGGWADEHHNAYDDYALLAQELAPAATVLDVSEAARWDEDFTAIIAKCPGIQIITQKTDNVNNISTRKAEASEIYTLSGVRVDKANKKGIYVLNGKKIVK